GEERGDVRRDHRPHVRHLLDRRLVGIHEPLEWAEMLREREGRGLAHFAYAEPVEQSWQRRPAAAVDGCDEIRCGLLSHALELRELRGAERVDIRGSAHRIALDELLDELVAEPLDVERPAAREVAERLLTLRTAYETSGAPSHRLASRSQHPRSAHRTVLGELHRLGTGRALVKHDAHHLRDHITRAAHHHRVADTHVLALHLIYVVERHAAHRHTAHEYRLPAAPRPPAHESRLEARHRCQCPGAPDLEADVLHDGERFIGRELVRDRPA